MRKKIFLYTILCLICFVLGIAVSKYNKLAITDDSFYINKTKIVLEDDINKIVTEEYIKNIKKMPKELLSNCVCIIITSEDLNKKFNLGFTNTVLAVTIDDVIYINDSKYKSDVVIHELFHVYDYHNNWISINNDNFKEIYELEKENIKVSPGNKENEQEFFATIGTQYYLEPNDLERYSPNSYDFLKNLLAND